MKRKRKFEKIGRRAKSWKHGKNLTVNEVLEALDEGHVNESSMVGNLNKVISAKRKTTFNNRFIYNHNYITRFDLVLIKSLIKIKHLHHK